MKVVQINAVASTSSTGRTTIELHEALKNAGYQSWIAAPDASDTTEAIKIGNVIDRRFHSLYSRVLGRQGFASWHSTRKLIRRLHEIRPDVVHLRNLHGNYINLHILLTYLAENNVAVVITLHDCWFFTGHCCYFIDTNCDRWRYECGKCPDLHNWNKSWLFDRSASNLRRKRILFGEIKRLAVIGVSNWVTSFIKDSILKNACIIKSIYNWIDTDIFYPMDVRFIRKKYAQDNEKIILGVSHVWDREKGLSDFLALANLLPHYKFILVGSIDHNLKLPENILTPGRTDNASQLAVFYSIADVFFNPSRRETFGKVTAEALACGTPVVAYNVTATPELVTSDCGALVKVGDIRDAALKIDEVLASENIGERCRNFALCTFNKKKLIGSMINLYREISEIEV